jgi:hypothetical protein
MPYTLGNYGGVYHGSDMVYIANLEAGMSLMTIAPRAKFLLLRFVQGHIATYSVSGFLGQLNASIVRVHKNPSPQVTFLEAATLHPLPRPIPDNLKVHQFSSLIPAIGPLIDSPH